MEIIKKANAKINLSLDLTGILPNGYHAIRTVMQSVTLCDTVHIAEGTPGIRLSCDAPCVPTDERNTAFRAAQLFCAAAEIPPAVRIRIEKRIPSQAGLGGGSADAAAVLRGMNEMYGEPLTTSQLLKIAPKIGADVPFALIGGTRLCLNIGEIMADLPHYKTTVLIAKPDVGVSTGAAYEKFDSGVSLHHPDTDRLLYYFSAGDPRAALASAGNVFEQLTQLPEGDGIKTAMLQNGAYFASMSGSGSAYYGLFDSPAAARNAENALQTAVPFLSLCETAENGIE